MITGSAGTAYCPDGELHAAGGKADGPRACLAALADVSPDLPRYAAVTAYLHERAGDLEHAAELHAEATVGPLFGVTKHDFA